MGNNAAENLGIVLAAIVGVSLALTQAVGPLLVYLTEAIKSTGKVKDGYAGVVTLILGMVIGGALGGLTDAMSEADSYSFSTMVALGVFGGALMAAGAVKTYKAMGDVNAKTGTLVVDSSALQLSNQSSDDDVEHAVNGTPTLSLTDVADMRAALAEHDEYVADASTPNVLTAPPVPTEPMPAVPSSDPATSNASGRAVLLSDPTLTK